MLIASFDASTNPDNKGILRSSVGYVIKDVTGRIVKKGAANIKGNCNNYKAEYEAMLKLSQELCKLQPKGMAIIKGDAKFVIDHLRELQQDPEAKPKGYRNFAKKILRNLLSIYKFHPYFTWVPRKKNKEADFMSGRASGKYKKKKKGVT